MAVLDAPLTQLGRKQASSLPRWIPKLQQEADLVVTSPLARTLQTALLGWRPAIDRLGVENVICIPEAQECNDFPCDVGLPRDQLEQNPEYKGLNFSRLTPDWTSKSGFWAPDSESIAKRARTVRHFLRERSEKNIVLVAHGDVLRQITCDAAGPSTYKWKNAEVQVWRFDPATVDTDDCFLVLDEVVEAAGGWAPTSTDIEINVDGETNGKI